MARVLVVEDEDALLCMVAELIEDLGHEPVLATDGGEALETLHSASSPPALIITDVMMPRMNGIALIETIKRDMRLRTVPVIMMSAAGRPTGSSVADHFIAKPFDLNMLAKLIERYT
jgi:CheY-like chemotaxis protein